MTKTNNTIKWRVECLERFADRLENKVDRISENHIPHLSQEIEKLSGKIDANKTRITVLSALNAGAIIVAVLLTKLL